MHGTRALLCRLCSPAHVHQHTKPHKIPLASALLRWRFQKHATALEHQSLDGPVARGGEGVGAVSPMHTVTACTQSLVCSTCGRIGCGRAPSCGVARPVQRETCASNAARTRGVRHRLGRRRMVRGGAWITCPAQTPAPRHAAGAPRPPSHTCRAPCCSGWGRGSAA